MFGLSFGEFAVVIIVAIVVIGPKDMPKVLRKLGEWSGKLRRMAFDLRAQSGIDDVLHAEGLAADIQEIRKLARGELDGVMADARAVVRAASLASPTGIAPAPPPAPTDGTGIAGSATGDMGTAHGAFPYGSGGGGMSYARSGGDAVFEAAKVARAREYPLDGADAYGALPDGGGGYEDLAISAFAADPIFTAGFETPPPYHRGLTSPIPRQDDAQALPVSSSARPAEDPPS